MWGLSTSALLAKPFRISEWEVERNKGFEPQVAGQGYMHPGQPGQYVPHITSFFPR